MVVGKDGELVGSGSATVGNVDHVFVVYGRNAAAKDAMFAFLRALGLKPREFTQAVAQTKAAAPYLGQILDAAFATAQAVVVLFTPDEIVYLDRAYATGEDDPDLNPTPQARPNVLFEAGMAMGLHPERTVLVEMGTMRAFSDVAGRHSVRMTNDAERRIDLANRLENAGCPVDRSGADWMKAGDFTLPDTTGGLARGKKIATVDRRGAHVDGNWHDNGSSRFDLLKITNNGAVPIFEVTIETSKDLDAVVIIYQDAPLARLPVGKSFSLRADAHNKTMGGPRAPDQFDLVVKGRLDDGTEFRQEIFIDLIG